MVSKTLSTFNKLSAFTAIMDRMKRIPLECDMIRDWPDPKPNAPIALGFWAHPDDEILTGGAMIMRLLRAGYQVFNIAMTLGEPNQVGRRHKELQAVCDFLGMELFIPNNAKGFYYEVRKGRLQEDWPAVNEISEIIQSLHPKIIMVHQDEDEHPDHVGTSRLVNAALKQILFDLDCTLVEGEWWRDMREPNLQLEIDQMDLAFLLEALSRHKGELERNPYQIALLLLSCANSQYGEVVTGWGDAGAPFDFSVMYRLRRVRNGRFISSFAPTQLPADVPIESIFPS
jgi:LmbE family N-acetylglucosaminyl deacetylase